MEQCGWMTLRAVQKLNSISTGRSNPLQRYAHSTKVTRLPSIRSFQQAVNSLSCATSPIDCTILLF